MTSARTPSSAARAPRMAWSAAANSPRSATTCSSQFRICARRSSIARTSSSSRRSACLMRRAQLLAAHFGALRCRCGAAGCARRVRAPLPRGGPLPFRGRPAARRAWPAPVRASVTRRIARFGGLARVLQLPGDVALPRLRVALLRVVLRDGRQRRFAPRSRRPALLLPRAGGRWSRSPAAASSRAASSAARRTSASRPTMDFSHVVLRRSTAAASARLGRRNRGVARGQLGGHAAADRPPVSRHCSRSVASSARVSRMPRASWRDPPSTRQAPRKTSPASVATGTRTVRARRRASSNVGDDQGVPEQAAESRRRAGRARCTTADSGLAPAGTSTARVRQRLRRGFIENQESAAARVPAGQQRQRAGHVVGAFHDDVLEPVAQERVHGALVRTARRSDDRPRRRGGGSPCAGVVQQEPRGVTERRAARVELLERADARIRGGQVALARADGGRAGVRVRLAGPRVARRPAVVRRRGLRHGARAPRRARAWRARVGLARAVALPTSSSRDS